MKDRIDDPTAIVVGEVMFVDVSKVRLGKPVAPAVTVIGVVR